jgi:hypothetical protein
MSQDRFGSFLTLASVALAALVVLLAWQNRGLKEELAACLSSHAVPADSLGQGDVLSAVPVFDPDGKPASLDLVSGVHVLMIYSSTCPACEQTLPIWNDWLRSGALGGATVLAVRTDPPSAGATSAPSPAALLLPVYLADRSGVDPLRRIYAVPCTLVVGPGGVVRVAVYGVPTEEDAAGIRDALTG